MDKKVSSPGYANFHAMLITAHKHVMKHRASDVPRFFFFSTTYNDGDLNLRLFSRR